MALNEQDALERADRLRRSVRRSRLRWEARWALNMAYAAGKQWSRISTQPTGSRHLKRLREIIDPNRTDVRLTMDIIHQSLDRTIRALKPQKISMVIRAKSGKPDALVARHVYNGLMNELLPQINALETWRSLHGPRCVLGSVGIRRQIITAGKPVTLPKEYQSDSKIPLRLRNLQVKWSRVLPFEILRDPSATDLDPNINEVIIGHEKPRTVEWIKRNYGIEIKTKTTYGDLMSYTDSVSSATGWWWESPAAQDSREPAVMVYEFFYQDAEMPEVWPWQLLSYFDPGDVSDAETGLKPMHFGRSPFYDNPLSFLHYDDTNIMDCWGRGLPELMKSVQDVNNLTWTTMARVMIDHYPKWRIQKGTIENPESMLMNRTDQPLIFKRNPGQDQHIPDRLPAPSASPVASELLNRLDAEVGRLGGVAPVQRGEMVKRGQAGKAYEVVIEQAEVPMNDLRKDDELTLNKLLYGTMVDSVRLLRSRRDIARKMLPDFSREQLSVAFRKDPADVIRAVEVTPESLRHRTPTQIRDDFSNDARDQLMSPIEAKREMLIQGDIITDTRMANAYRKQELELEMLLAGEEVEVTAGEDHATSMWVLENFMSSTQWHALTDKQRQFVQNHWFLHRDVQQQLMMMEAMGSATIPAGGAQSQPAQMGEPAPGSVGPEVNIAG